MNKKLVVLFFIALTSVCYAQTEEELFERHKKEIAKKHESPNKPVANGTTQKNIDWNYFFCYGDMFDWRTTVREWKDNYVLGASYSYSKMFPLGFSLDIRQPIFSFGAEFGRNFDDKKYTRETVFSISSSYVNDSLVQSDTIKYYYLLDPKFYTTVKVAFSIPYVDLGCGIGALCTKDQLGNKNYWFWFLKPEITGYIPICDFDYYISLHVGYNLPLKSIDNGIWEFNEGRGLTLGMGFHFWL